jgi:hypothetical protein
VRWVIGLFAGLSISLLLVGGFGYSLVPEEPTPLGMNGAAAPAGQSSVAVAPEAKSAPAPPAPTTPPAAEATMAAATAPKKVQPPAPSTPVTPSGPEAVLPTKPTTPTAAAPAAPLLTAMPAEAAMSEADRHQIQEALRRLGFDPGPADGLFGPLTRAAIRGFQQSIGTAPTGVITADEASRLVSMPALATNR